MTRLVSFLITAALTLSLAGCLPSVDVTIRNPVVARALDRNGVVKQHGYTERVRGLPQGAMADEASLTRVGDDVCFDVKLHELDPIDMATVRAKLMVPGEVARDQAKLWPEQPVARDYSGLVPVRTQTGYETYCSARAYNGVCLAWQTRPTYGVVMQPGTVQVFESRARLCFPNGGFVSAETEVMQLDLVVPRPAKSFEGSYNGWGGLGGGDKHTVFGWGLAGALPKKK